MVAILIGHRGHTRGHCVVLACVRTFVCAYACIQYQHTLLQRDHYTLFHPKCGIAPLILMPGWLWASTSSHISMWDVRQEQISILGEALIIVWLRCFDSRGEELIRSSWIRIFKYIKLKTSIIELLKKFRSSSKLRARVCVCVYVLVLRSIGVRINTNIST